MLNWLSEWASVAPQIPVPQHRLTPLKEAWLKLYEPVTQNLKLDMRMNLRSKKVSIVAGLPSCTGCSPHESRPSRTSPSLTPDICYCFRDNLQLTSVLLPFGAG